MRIDVDPWAGRERLTAAALLAWWTFFLLVGFVYGPIHTDDAARDMAYARQLVALDFNPLRYLSEAEARSGFSHPVPLLFYSAYVYCLALLDVTMGAKWQAGLIVVNALAFAVSATLTVRLAARLTASVFGVAIAAAFLVGLFDYWQWVAMSQSDAMFVGATTATFYFAVEGAAATAPAARRRAWLVAMIAFILAVLTRPTWPPLLPMLLVAAVTTAATGFRYLKDLARRPLAWAALAGFVVGVIGLAALMQAIPEAFPAALVPEAAATYREHLKLGAVVLVRPETYVSPGDSFWTFAHVMLLRIPYFFWFVASAFSGAHVTLNVAGHVPLYAGAVAGILIAIATPHVERRVRIVALVTSAWLISVALFHAVTVLDFDWRYRAPVYPPMIALAAVGAVEVLRRALRRSAAQSHRPG